MVVNLDSRFKDGACETNMERIKNSIHPSTTVTISEFGSGQIAPDTALADAVPSYRRLTDVITAGVNGTVYGYAGIVSSGYFMIDADPALMELSELRIFSPYHGRSIGTKLLKYSCDFARSRNRRLILQPLRTGDMLTGDKQDKEYPLTTTQLRDFYLNRGFRTFTPDEVEILTMADEDRYLAQELWRYGFDPHNPREAGQRRYHVSADATAEFSNIPHTNKLKLLKQYYEQALGSSVPIFVNRDIQRKKIEKHLIQA